MASKLDLAQDPYRWEGLRGWKSYRMLRPGRGMYHDVRRRLPYYLSDITDGFNYRTFAGTVRIYFVNLLPALAFTLDMSRRTGGYFGINESLFASALAAVAFSIFSVQPLTVVGITGLISLFNYTIFDIVSEHDPSLYPGVMVWVSIWTAITHWIASFGNLCDYMRYITDFSSNTFAMYVGIIYVEKGVQELVDQFHAGDATQGFYSIVIALLFSASVWSLEFIGSTIWFKPWIRGLLADYAYPICTIFWTGFSHIPNSPLQSAGLLTVPHTAAFHPTIDRNWIVPFWQLPVKWIFVSLPIGILLTLLFYYDHNVSSLTAQAKQFPLTKPAGFHWDFFLLGCTSFIAGVFGLPLPNGLVPQAPVHTDALTQYEDKLSIVRTDDGEEIHRKVTVPDKVMEQRVSHGLMALALIGTMTGPLLIVLHTIPRALFAGVFFVVGFGSVLGNNLTGKFTHLLQERRFVSPSDPMGTLPKARIAYFLSWQVLAVAATVAISQTIGAIGFPVLIMSLIPFRWTVMPRLFTEAELAILDAPTADNPVVLVSLGGMPELMKSGSTSATQSGSVSESALASALDQSEVDLEKMENEEQTLRERGVKRERVGDYTRA